MKREYSTGTNEKITFFVGKEIEKTPAFNMDTLFVVGCHSVTEIQSIIKNAELEITRRFDSNLIKHIYFGANQSFDAAGDPNNQIWGDWAEMIKGCLDAGYWCTLDFDVKDIEGMLETGLTEYRRFIPQISVKIPYLTQLGYNATLKIDDIDFDKSNPGVWCHRLDKLINVESFTNWDEYGKDIIIK